MKVAVELVTDEKLASAAFVAWIKHVPAVVAVMELVAVAFASVQPVAVPPAKIAYVVAPVPDPPVGVIVMAWFAPAAAVAISSEIERALCAAAVKVKVRSVLLVADEKLASAALVALIKHVPTVVAVRVAEAVASESAQVLAVPPATMA